MADSTISNLPANTTVDPANDALPLVHNGTTQKVTPQSLVNSAFPQVPFTPSGSISATTVAGAINELDTEKAALSVLSASSGSSLIGVTPAGSISATTVAGAINELDTEKAAVSALPTTMSQTTAQAGTSTTAQTISAAVLDSAVEYGAFTPAGTGAVSRTIQSKLKDYVNVLDFGADPTGATDSSPAIQLAINYALTKNGTVYFPAGTYLINTSLNATYAGVAGPAYSGYYGICFEGEGRNATYLLGKTSGYPIIDITGKGTCTFKNFTFTTESSLNANNPSCAVLTARNTTNSGAGQNEFQNIAFKFYYTRACVVSISSEVNRYIDCGFDNFYSSQPAFICVEQNTTPSGTGFNIATPSLYLNTQSHSFSGGNTWQSFFSCSFNSYTNGHALVLANIQNITLSSCYSYTQASSLGVAQTNIAHIFVLDNTGISLVEIHGHRTEGGSAGSKWGIKLGTNSTLQDANIVASRFPCIGGNTGSAASYCNFDKNEMLYTYSDGFNFDFYTLTDSVIGSGNYSGSVSISSVSRNNQILNKLRTSAISLPQPKVATFASILAGGTLYTDGTYSNVVLTYVNGSKAIIYPTVNITVSGGSVTSVTLVSGGIGFKDTTTIMTCLASSIGGTGSGFLIMPATLTTGSTYTTRYTLGYIGGLAEKIDKIENGADVRHYFNRVFANSYNLYPFTIRNASGPTVLNTKDGGLFQLMMTGNINNFIIFDSNATEQETSTGKQVKVAFCQDAVGGRTVSVQPYFINPTVLTGLPTTANLTTLLTFTVIDSFDQLSSKWYISLG